MEKILTLKELTSIESNNELLRFRFAYDEILMWPLIRHFILVNSVRTMFKVRGLDIPPTILSFTDILKYIAMTAIKNPYSNYCEKNGILIFSTGIVNIKTKNNLFMNRLYDHFAFLYPDKTTIIEDSVQNKYLVPRVFQNVRYHDYIRACAFVKGKLSLLNRKDKATIDGFIVFLKRTFSYDLSEPVWEKSREILINASRKLVFFHRYYKELFEKFEPKMLVVEEGCYGNRSFLLKWAKDFCIKTCEIQHGWVGRNHLAYNFGDCLFGQEYRRYVPDYFLSFGDYWNDKISIPSKIVTIGNPHMTESLKGNTAHIARNKSVKTILIISGGTAPEILLKTAISLRNKLSNDRYRVVFRPWAGEVQFCEERYGALKKYNIEFDFGDLYRSLSESDYLIAMEFSTILFETMAFDIKAYILKNEWIKYCLGENDRFDFFEDVDYLVNRIKSGNKEKKVNIEDYWNSNWINNYKNFIENTIGLA